MYTATTTLLTLTRRGTHVPWLGAIERHDRESQLNGETLDLIGDCRHATADIHAERALPDFRASHIAHFRGGQVYETDM